MQPAPPILITHQANPRAGAVAAILITPDSRYLLQLRDDKRGIWDPGRWGCFGGSIDDGEQASSALLRELAEELELHPTAPIRYFTQVAWDYGLWGHGIKLRRYYEVPVSLDEVARTVVHEGQTARLFTADEVLREPLLTSYDSHALRMHIRVGLPL